MVELGDPGKRKVFQSKRFACHTSTPNFNCSGNRLGSAAALNASIAKTAEAEWCPCPALASGGKRVKMISGRNLRITQTISDRINSFPQKPKASSVDLEKPKSKALEKY